MRRHPIILGFVVVIAIGALGAGKPAGPVVVAALAMYVLLMVGVVMLGGLARPVPAPLPAGELRKVRLLYRCSICGTEVRMTAANDEDPEPPRHCLEDMDLVAPAME
ncbi:MAG TPA: hypothetical protein VIJ47_07360 [Acidimicrobiales bacterium]